VSAGHIGIDRLDLQDLLAELGAAHDEVQSAALDVIRAAEAAQVAAPDQVSTALADVFATCGFADVVGQRLAKVRSALASLLGDPAAQASPREGAHLLNGPRLGGPEVSQASIDALFD